MGESIIGGVVANVEGRGIELAPLFLGIFSFGEGGVLGDDDDDSGDGKNTGSSYWDPTCEAERLEKKRPRGMNAWPVIG